MTTRPPLPENPSENRLSSSREPRFALGAAAHLFWRCLPDLVICDLLFKLLTFVALAPCGAWLFRRFIAASGDDAIANFDIARFLLTPFGLAVSLALATLFAAISFAEFAGLMHIGYGAAEGQRVRPLDSLRFVALRIPRILGASLQVLVVLTAAALPFVAVIVAAAWMLTSAHDVNYYLDARPPEFWTVLAIGVFIAIIAAVVLAIVSAPLAFVLPEALYRGEPLRAAFSRSRSLVKGRFRRIAAAIIGWLALWGFTSLVVQMALYAVGRGLVGFAADRVGILLAVLGGLTAINLLASAVVAFGGAAIGCLLVVQLHREACQRQGVELPKLAQQGTGIGDNRQRTILRRVVLAGAVLVPLLATLIAVRLLEGVRLEDRVDITAHRGSSLAAPENTLAAVERAIADGATYVEVDVQHTADRVLVVAHDADLMRVARAPLVIARTEFAKLREVDMGGRFAEQFAGERLPTLDEVIDKTKGRVKLIVELKSYSGDAALLAADVVRVLRSRDLLTEAVVMSLKYKELLEVQRLEPRIVTGFVSSAALGDVSRLHVDFLAVSTTRATDALIGAAHGQGKEVYVWTVDDPDQMFTMIDRGVDNIITNDPATLVGMLRQRTQLGIAERILLRFKSLYLQ